MAKIEMPKNTAGNPEVDVIAEDITTALARIDWLLNGNVDADNIAHKENDTAEVKLLIPASKVQDIPLISNEIVSNKFIRDEDGKSYKTDIFDVIAQKVNESPPLTVIDSTLSIKITKDTIVYNRNLEFNYNDFDFGGNRDVKGKYNSIYKVKERLIAEIPSTHIPLNYERFRKITGIEYEGNPLYKNAEEMVIQHSYNVDSSIASTSDFSIKIDEAQHIKDLSIVMADVIFTASEKYGENMSDSDFINIDITISVLCEERI